MSRASTATASSLSTAAPRPTTSSSAPPDSTWISRSCQRDWYPIRDGVAPLYGGAVLPEYRHLYITSATHPIYGFGPLITAGGDLLARLIPLQDRIELPLGRVLKACGMKPATTHLLHPAAALRELRWARRLLPVIVPFVERRLRRTDRSAKPPAPAAETPSESFNPDMKVY